MSDTYHIPAEQHRVEIVVNKSRFIATAGYVGKVDEAKAFLARIRQEMPDASHHVYAYRVGYGNSITEGLSDDGEPTGTSGPPAMAVLRGHDIGDVIVVITRYFGGRKLGKGGLVRAYSDAVREVLQTLPTILKIETQTLIATLPYTHYALVCDLVAHHEGTIIQENFEVHVSMNIELPASQLEAFQISVRDTTSGTVEFVPIEL